LFPAWVCERELTSLDSLHDLLVTSTIERWNTRQHDVSNNTTGPNIALFIIVFGENLWSNVVGSTQLFVQLLILLEVKGGTKINDLNLIELFVLLQQDIFGF
jgi:hypothetical protein